MCRLRLEALDGHTGASEGTVSIRILIIDDNFDLADSMRRLLAHHGFHVAMATNGQTGLEVARAFQPKAVLLDIGLPDMDGYQVAEALRRDVGLEQVLLIAISAYDPEHGPLAARSARFDHYLIKPVEFEQLLPMLPHVE
jgi:DNA-binding response OmpR family regulator